MRTLPLVPTRAVLKNWYGNISWYLFLWYRYHDMYCVVRSLPKLNLKAQWHRRTLMCFIFILSISVCPVKVHLNFILGFDVMAATEVCLVIFQYHSNKLERKFWIKLFWLNLSVKLPISWDVKCEGYPSNTVICICFYIFSDLFWISHYASSCNVTWYNHIVTHVSCCVSYCEVLANTSPSPNSKNDTKYFSYTKWTWTNFS